MKKAKKILCVLMGLVLCFGFCSCAPKTPKNNYPKVEIPADDVVKEFSLSDERNLDKVVLTPSFVVDKNVPTATSTELELDCLLQNGMVLQQKTVNRLHGKTTSSVIAAEFNEKMYFGSVKNGEFEIYISPLDACNSAFNLTVFGEGFKVSLRDVFVGEVFICAGQSNMDFEMFRLPPHATDISSANDDKLRLLVVDKTITPTAGASKQTFVKTYGWQASTPEYVKNFSAFGYLYGRRLREKLGVPVGLIKAAISATGLSYWLPDESYKALVENGTRPFVDGNASAPSVGFNALINPLATFSVRGVVWYQGETEAMNDFTDTYAASLNALADGWRKAFNNPNMLWTIVELPRYNAYISQYAAIRTAQQIASEKDELMVLSASVDLGEWMDIHPTNKLEQATRAADETMFNFFNIDSPRCPKITKVERLEDGKIRLTLKNVGTGLVLKNGGNGFELSTNKAFSIREGITVSLEESRCVIISYKDKIKTIEYGVNPLLDKNDYPDVSTQVSIFNSFGLPLDQFKITIK